MTQPYKDWNLKESRDFGTYKYEIFHVTDKDDKQSWRGWVFWGSGNAQWLEADSIDALRLALINVGRQGS